MQPLNIFYAEPDPDRWLPFDRFPRRALRRVIRGAPQPGGQTRVFLNLCAGLDRLAVEYRVNDFKYIKQHHDEVACLIGKPHLLETRLWRNPILFGASIYSHPSDQPDLFNRYPVKRALVPGEWMRRMFEPVWGDKVYAWAVGIDTELWQPAPEAEKDIDILLYDKVRWEHERFESELINPVRAVLEQRNLKIAVLRYGYYREAEFHALLRRARAMVFLCEHETQGIAYQQALACGVPVLAWERGGFWQDPSYFPHKVKYQGGVSSVPYWDARCGLKFADALEFPSKLNEFLDCLGNFDSRAYVLENLTLEKCAQEYLHHYKQVWSEVHSADIVKI